MLPEGPGDGARQVTAGPPSVEADVHAGRGVGDGRVAVGVEGDDDLSGFVLGLDARVHALALVASGVGVAHGDRAVLRGLVDDDHGVADRDLGHLVGVGLDGDDGQFAHRLLARARPYRAVHRPARRARTRGDRRAARRLLGRVRGRIEGPRRAPLKAGSVGAYSTARSASGWAWQREAGCVSLMPRAGGFAFKDESDT